MCEHGRSRLVEWAAAGDAQDRMLDAPGALAGSQARWSASTGAASSSSVGVLVLVVAQVLDHLFDRIADLELLLLRELAVRGICLRQGQRRHGHGVVVGRQALLLELLLRHVGSLGIVAGKQALIETLVRLQCRLISEQHFDELQRLDVRAEDDKADGQGRRQKQPDRPPQQRPEERRDDDGNRRQACVLTVEQRLDDMSGNRLGHKEQAGGRQHHGPAGIDRSRQHDRKKRRDNAADERNEPHQAGKDSPQHGVGHADQPQAAAMNTPKPALRSVCMRKKRLRRLPASSRAAVER